jgi:hypothetical protein
MAGCATPITKLYGVWKLHEAEREPDTGCSLRVRLVAEGRLYACPRCQASP